MKKALFLALLICFQTAWAKGEHDLTEITGKDIALKLYDHAIAGSIKDFVIFGNKDDATNISELIIKKDGQVIKTEFKKLEQGFGGMILHTDVNRVVHQTKIELVDWNIDQNKIILKMNNQLVETTIKADDFQNNHFKNPTFHVVFADGESIEFKILNGEACYNFSTHLIMMIAGAYIH